MLANATHLNLINLADHGVCFAGCVAIFTGCDCPQVFFL